MTERPDLDVLVIDDERNIRRTLAIFLEQCGCRVTQAATGATALEALRRERFDLAFCDLRLRNESGLKLVPRLLAEQPALQVVVVTAYATLETTLQAMRCGAKDYLPKPFRPERIAAMIQEARQRLAPSIRMGAASVPR